MILLRSHRTATATTCQVCGCEIWVEPNQLAKGEGKFCSYACHGQWNSIHNCGPAHPTYNPTRHEQRVCMICNQPFQASEPKQQTCSSACGQKLAGSHRQGEAAYNWSGGEDRTCPICQQVFHVLVPTKRQVYCSKHCARKGSRHSQYQTRVYTLVCAILGPQLIMEQTFDWLRSSRGRNLYLDIFDPLRNLAIEVDGRQHFVDGCFSSDSGSLQATQERDTLKAQLLAAHNIRLLRVTGNLTAMAVNRLLTPFL